ncbi:MAG TPA: hypothetical protein EYP24_02965, partial [bacterium (Candidatus Stahlbacteria)]|nr:hypothetical protein [Candidatus Stahlbacteria bacterium]
MFILLFFLLPRLYFFYSPDCGHCYDILYGIIEDVKRGKKAEVLIYDITEPENYLLLEDLESRYRTSGEKIPIIFFRGRGLYGNDEILERLPGLLKEKPVLRRPNPEIVFLTRSGCPSCNRVGSMLRAITEEYPHVKIIFLDLATDSGAIMAEAISIWLEIPEKNRLISPTIFIDSTYLLKGEISYRKVKELIRKHPIDSTLLGRIPSQYLDRARTRIVSRFKKLTIIPVIIAGLIDGINPCAFAT